MRLSCEQTNKSLSNFEKPHSQSEQITKDSKTCFISVTYIVDISSWHHYISRYQATRDKRTQSLICLLIFQSALLKYVSYLTEMSTLCGMKSKHLQVALRMGPGKYRHNLSTNGSFKLCIQGPLELNSKCATHSVGFLNLLKGDWEGAFFHDSRLDWQWVVLVWLPQRCTCININMVPLLKRKKKSPTRGPFTLSENCIKMIILP